MMLSAGDEGTGSGRSEEPTMEASIRSRNAPPPAPTTALSSLSGKFGPGSTTCGRGSSPWPFAARRASGRWRKSENCSKSSSAVDAAQSTQKDTRLRPCWFGCLGWARCCVVAGRADGSAQRLVARNWSMQGRMTCERMARCRRSLAKALGQPCSISMGSARSVWWISG